MAESDSDLSPASKRLKTLVGALTPGPPPHSSSKGKDKVMPEQDAGAPSGAAEEDCSVADKDPEEEEKDSRTCGICFSEEGRRSIRGWIDCCDHYFCFVCIMEWSKVESRCPLCKQRFGSIRRALVRGLFNSERIVTVPVRNQVYHTHGIETEVYSDPYAETTCSECYSTEDENLLLLCDLCDSAAHTYCVGLGAIVPEGDWFCHDCNITKLEHSTVESDSEGPLPIVHYESNDNHCSEEGFQNIHGRHTGEVDDREYNQEQDQDQSDQERLPDIIHEIISDNTSCDRRQASYNLQSSNQQNNQICSTSNRHIEQNDSSVASRNSLHENATCSEAKIDDQRARTVRRCRDVNKCIRRLRENWDSLRSGSLSFKSSFSFSNTTSSLPINRGLTKIDSRSSKKTELSCKKTKHIDNNTSSQSPGSRKPKDIDRAWKMMEAALSVQKRHSGISSKCQVSRYPCKMGISKEIYNGDSHLSPSKKDPFLSKVQRHDVTSIDGILPVTIRSSGNSEPHVGNLSSNGRSMKTVGGNYIHNGKEQVPHQLQILHAGSVNGNLAKTYRSSDNSEMQNSDFSSSNRFMKVVAGVDVSPNREEQAPPRVSHESSTSSQQVHLPSFPNHSKSMLAGSSFGAFESPVPMSEPSDLVVPGIQMVIQRTGRTVDENSEKLSLPSDDDKKSEIQSLVKLNLKLVRVVRPLGTELFKKVAKVSTHTILAACGMEHSKSTARPFPSVNCKHSEVRSFQCSNLMPAVCRKCFYSFVKDVVNNVASEHN